GLKNKHAVISIEDTGTGISEKVKKKIFTPFFTTKAVGEGTGLGLAVSNEIITAHNGFIIFKNNEQKGTTFEIFLPLNSIGSK
ncbi:MAG: HAMP domain-containing histidine kinase, partial [Elusimicrobiales bacterium]|nr:HAMP domain-containing histidine kinase [Elusimicrobiales bacterium]